MERLKIRPGPHPRGRAAIGTVYSGVPRLFGKLTPRVKEIYVGVGNSTEAYAA